MMIILQTLPALFGIISADVANGFSRTVFLHKCTAGYRLLTKSGMVLLYTGT